MYPILFTIGKLEIRSSTTFFILACIVCLWVGWKEILRIGKETNKDYSQKLLWEFFIPFLPFVYLCGMVNGWLLDWNYYFVDPTFIKFLLSGWISYGGILGALVFGYFYPKFVKTGIDETLDTVALVMPLFEGVYRIGCLLNGCCYGKRTARFGGIYLPNINGEWAVRYPTQILYIILGFGLFLLLWVIRKKNKYEGELALQYLFFYGIGRFLIDPMRANIPNVGLLNLYQVLDLGLCFAALIIWLLINKLKKTGK